MTTQNKTRVADVTNTHEFKMKLISLKNQLTAVNDTALSRHFRCYREYPYTYVSVPKWLYWPPQYSRIELLLSGVLACNILVEYAGGKNHNNHIVLRASKLVSWTWLHWTNNKV